MGKEIERVLIEGLLGARFAKGGRAA